MSAAVENDYASPVTRADARSGNVQDIAVVVVKATPVTFARALAPAPRPRVSVLDATGIEHAIALAGSRSYGPEHTLHLPQGDYEIVITLEGEVLHRRRLTVGTEPIRVDLGR